MFIGEAEEAVPAGGGRARWLARRAGAWWIGEPPHWCTRVETAGRLLAGRCPWL